MAVNARPIRPSEVAKQKQKEIPDAALEAFNEIIAKHFLYGFASFEREEVVALMVKKGLKRKDIYDNGWLNVEKIYRAAGWEVEYDAPGYNESYPPRFSFRDRCR